MNVAGGGASAGQAWAADPNTNEWATCTRPNGWEFWSHGSGGIRSIINAEGLEVYNSDYRGIACFSDYAEVNFGPGIISAWAAEEAFSFSGVNDSVVTMAGSPSARILGRGCGQWDVDEEAIYITGARQWVEMSYTDLIDNGGEVDLNENVPDLTDNCFLVGSCQGEDFEWNCGNFRIGFTNSSPTTKSLQNTTIHDCAAPTNDAGIMFGWTDSDNCWLVTSNVIVSGTGDVGIKGRPDAFSAVYFYDSALVTAGPDALEAETSAGDLVIMQSNVTNADPQYCSYVYTYGALTDYLRVSNSAYSGAGPASGDLTGAGGPIGPCTGIEDWMVF
jgi:hypothetical protein